MEVMVRLDGQLIAIPPEIVNLEGLLEHVFQNSLPNGREIIEVKLDGNTFSEEFPHESALLTSEDFKIVDIITQDSGDFAELSLQQFPYFISIIKKGFRTACDYLRDGYLEKEGNKLVANSAESLGALISHFLHLIYNTKNGKSNDLKAAYNSLTGELAGLMDEIITAQKENDPILLADLLEFEIIPILDRLGARIEKILG